MKQLLNTGVIAERDYPAGNPVRLMAQEVLAGRQEPYGQDEIERIVDQRYFGFASLVSLTEEEKSFLRSDMTETLSQQFNDSTLKGLLETACYRSAHPNSCGHWDIYRENALRGTFNSSSLQRMSNQEKLAFLADPENLSANWHYENVTTTFARMGYRHFKEYSLGYGQRFAKKLRWLRSIQDRKELRVMDLGGGVGLALDDIKKAHPELVTYNATRDEEFAHYPADFHVVGFMERLPLALQGKIDLIFSNMATRYFAYTDRVIEGCVALLAQGGILDVFFSSERSDNRSEEDIKRRMKKAHDFLRDLESSKVIKLRIDHRFHGLGPMRSARGTLYPAASVFAQRIQ